MSHPPSASTIHGPLPLPPQLSPDDIDTLPPLLPLLLSLRSALTPPSSSTTKSSQPSGPPKPPPVTGTTPLPSSQPQSTLPFTTKELASSTDPIKHKLQRARQSVRQMEDISRVIPQQETEIVKLEERRKKQAEMLARIKEEGLLFSRSAELEGERGESGEKMVE
ncbi:RNA polymerase II transcription mediator complex subunit 9-domain-containing protein [Triangularia setosa]|uniref:Mediator of RNA polymerase II transcription subunit 9 n=1 Tax=Triangularia setosa TaxID=2587417 RepID=A0AAN6W6V7_9PEZI|nr:RNA polymerase II transcription mediator complex subunit 9-domain-containing protein [Podospora setosa]